MIGGLEGDEFGGLWYNINQKKRLKINESLHISNIP